MTAKLPRDVFEPGGMPSVTYVSRSQLRLEEQLKAGLDRKHSFAMVTGPTKTGKTVLCRRVLSERTMVEVDGGQIRTLDEFWTHVGYKLNVPTSATKGRTRGVTLTGLLEIAGGIKTIFTGKVSGSGAYADQRNFTANYNNVNMIAATKKLLDHKCTLLIEDFHYIEHDVKTAILRSLKNAVAKGLPVVLLAVPHRAFDPVMAEVELAGRVEHVDLPSWSQEDLFLIAEQGFAALGLNVPSNVLLKICEDGFGNPLLVQDLCLRIGEKVASGDPSKFGAEGLSEIYNEVVGGLGMRRYDRLGQIRAGATFPPKVKTLSGQEEALPFVVLTAIARLGPKPDNSFEDIKASLEALTEDALTAEDIEAALAQISEVGAEGGTPSLEWIPKERMLVITDPHLLFYLKWCISDRRTMKLTARAIDRYIGSDPGEAQLPTAGGK